ncbi:MAG: LysR family transcriptional regulator [Bauldia sp.]|nr:LysR family transcriptional regulator [Bauldia sp.]
MTFDSRLLNGIGVLAAVVEAGSFVGAGEALGLTQSGVSRAVARLEQRIGIRIFQRSARAIALTIEGREFFHSVQPHLSGIEEAALVAAGSMATIRGRLRIAIEPAFGNYVLAPAIGGFLHRFPEMKIELIVRDRMPDLVAEGFDAAIRFSPPELSAVTARLLLRTTVPTCAAPAYVAAYGMPKHPAELASHQCILVRNPATGRGYGWALQRGDEIVEVQPRGRLMVNDTGSLIGALLSGHGIAQPLGVYADAMIRDGRLVQLLPDWNDERFPLYVYHRSQQLMSARLRAFLDFVVEVATPLSTG